jgi:GxxExxY protein
MRENELAAIVFKQGMVVHKTLGPGLLESAYEECLYYLLRKENLTMERQKGMPLVFQEVRMAIGYRVDLLIERKLIVEIKSVESLTDVHLAQVLTYLKLSKCKLGLLINFNAALFKNGFNRVINGEL